MYMAMHGQYPVGLEICKRRKHLQIIWIFLEEKLNEYHKFLNSKKTSPKQPRIQVHQSKSHPAITKKRSSKGHALLDR